jgi:Cu(I)/Ag(I) efflux system protein CusF
MRTLVLSALLAAFAAGSAAASDSSHGSMSHGSHSGMAAGVHADATINSIQGDTVNVTHGPIPQIGWPAMTMDLKLLEGAETGGVQPGETAVMMLEKGPDGLYGIRALEKKD